MCLRRGKMSFPECNAGMMHNGPSIPPPPDRVTYCSSHLALGTRVAGTQQIITVVDS